MNEMEQCSDEGIRLRVNKKLSYKIYLRWFWLPTMLREKGKATKRNSTI